MKKILLPILLFVSIFTASAQDFLLTEQWFSRLHRNPAATGNSADLNLFYMNRQQWVGFKDAPSTNLLNVHTFFERINSGLGLTFYYDTEGVGDKALNVKLAYSYQIKLADEMLLSFGLSAGILNKSFDPSKLTYLDENNKPNIADESKTNFDMDLGVEFSTPVFMAGFSTTHLLDGRAAMLNVKTGRQFTGYARGNIGIGEKFNLAPGLVYNNYSSTAADFFELNVTAFYIKKIWLGVGTRFDSSFKFNTLNAMIGFEWRFLRIGYGYDFSLGKLGTFKKSTHEIMVSAKIPTCKAKTKQKFVRFMD
jgi:type IX secretion system PorP/SprF family membrane protein